MDKGTLHNEKELLILVAQGDPLAFTRIVEFYEPIISTYVLRLCGSAAICQEIVQDTFLKAWLKRTTISEVENFGGWLYRIAANIAYDALRKLKADARKLEVFKSEALPPEPAAFTTTEELLLMQQYTVLVQEAMSRLPRQQLEAFRLVKLQGMSREAAAKQMGVSQESVKSYIAIALQKIRAHCIARMGSLGCLLWLWASR